MELNHSFTVPVGADKAFEVLTDIERIAPCMPGASIDSVDGDDFTGSVKVKVGPMQVTYRGKATYAELDKENYTARIEAKAQEQRGSGTANATIDANLKEKGPEETEVNVTSSLAITGRPAQFGRGVMNEVGAKLIGQFADCLAAKLGEGDSAEEAGDGEAAETDTGAAESSEGGTQVGSNGSSAAASEQEITRQSGAASQQPVTGATTAAATGAPSAAAATSGATPASASASSSSTEASADTDTQPANQATTPKQTQGPDVEAIDLFEVAGESVMKRAVPAAGVALLLLLIILWRRRS